MGQHSILLTINVLQKRFIFQWAPLVFYDFSIYIRDLHDFSYNTSTFYNYIYTNFTNKIIYILDNINVKQITNNLKLNNYASIKIKKIRSEKIINW